jgi:sugar lactone lactonase YvrE
VLTRRKDHMRNTASFAFLVVLAAALAAASTPATPTALVGNLTLIASNFTWAENLAFDGRGALFVTDDMAGIIYRLERDPATLVVTKQAWVTGFHNALGLALAPTGDEMYAVVTTAAGVHRIIAVSTVSPNNTTNVSVLGGCGNGLARAAANVLYSPTETDFIPDLGKVFAVPTAGAGAGGSHTFDDHMWAADGAFIDPVTQLLYVSEVLTAKVTVYNVSEGPTASKGVKLLEFTAPGMKSLDDFCIARNATGGAPWLIGADFTHGNVVRFPAAVGAAQRPAERLVEGLRNPTSVREGLGRGWEGSLFITEGGKLLGKDHNRRVWELKL